MQSVSSAGAWTSLPQTFWNKCEKRLRKRSLLCYTGDRMFLPKGVFYMTTQEQAIRRFQKILQVPTVSRKDDSTDWAAFDAFLPMLKEQFPRVFEHCELTLINTYGIVLKWRGKDSSLQPVILMAHHDVVPVEGQDWHYPPFAAEIHDGTIYARGAVDTKCILAAVFEAMDALLSEG
ncbi:MAG: M20/M25/M40 family metallo-hydrolase, partial [Ruminococcaceae bacterium]|nr:M20/M25/M40 family metallo-hydrolase [Oscillospiraceae bacterium]